MTCFPEYWAKLLENDIIIIGIYLRLPNKLIMNATKLES